MAEQCGWKYIRLGRWEGGKQRVGIKDPDGNMGGYTVYEEELPCVTFTEKDKGVAVSVIRAILLCRNHPDGKAVMCTASVKRKIRRTGQLDGPGDKVYRDISNKYLPEIRRILGTVKK